MSGEYELYSYWRSSASWRVRIAMEYKGLTYKYHPINLLKGEQKGEEYSKMNPTKQVPTLILPDGTALCQSIAIIEYLDEIYPEKGPLLPRGSTPQDAVKRARVRHLAEIINSFIQPLQNPRIGKQAQPDSPQVWAASFIREGFTSLEKLLATTAGEYSFGDQVTMVDLCLVPQVYNALRNNVDMNEFPIISRIDANLAKLPEFQKAHPSSQPDAVPDK